MLKLVASAGEDGLAMRKGGKAPLSFLLRLVTMTSAEVSASESLNVPFFALLGFLVAKNQCFSTDKPCQTKPSFTKPQVYLHGSPRLPPGGWQLKTFWIFQRSEAQSENLKKEIQRLKEESQRQATGSYVEMVGGRKGKAQTGSRAFWEDLS